MNSFASQILSIGLLLCCHASGASALWRDDLPWDELYANLSPGSALIDTSPANYIEECSPEFDKNVFPELARSSL